MCKSAVKNKKPNVTSGKTKGKYAAIWTRQHPQA
jgi:hypothetical protein